MTTTDRTLLPNRFTERAERWWIDIVFKPELRNRLDPETMSVDEIREILRRRFPLAWPFKLMRQSANPAFQSGKCIFKIPIRPVARKFCSYEVQIANALPLDRDFKVPRIEISDVSISV